MCGRYLIEIDEKELKEIIAEVEKSGDERSLQLSAIFKGGEIFPGSIVPVITANNKVRFMTWGFPSIVNKYSVPLFLLLKICCATALKHLSGSWSE